MERALKILSITFLVIGSLALLSGVNDGGSEGLTVVVGGLMWVGYSICTLVYISQNKKTN